MLEALVDLYREPLFWLFPIGSSAVSMLAFALFAAPMSFIAYKDYPALRRFRIQTRKPRPQDLVGPSLRLWLLNNGLTLLLVTAAWPLLRLSRVHAGPLPPAWVVAAQVLLFIYVDDLLFYWMHRAMHAPWLFKRVHFVHHKIYTPWAVTAHYMHPLEYVLTASLMLLGPMVLGVHVVTLWCWIVVRQWEAAEGHSGYDFPWSPSRLLPFSDGAVHHDFHHAKVRGNYAGFLRLWDRVFGTYARDYGDDLAKRAPQS